MSDASDGLVDVMANVLWQTDFLHLGPAECRDVAGKQFAALVSRYGEPAFQDMAEVPVTSVFPHRKARRRLVFPWRGVKEGDEG